MSGKKCKHCGSSEIEIDPARGDAVCTNCGTVLDDNIIVAEIEFQENAHGGASALGQFVSAESKGGATGFGGSFNAGAGQESREITLRRARNGITALSQQLRLNQQCIDIACNFFKMALSRHLTIGRPSSHTQAACVYITCRTEGTPHLLIDISDALQICCYQLGRTYFKLSRALCINIPPTDPCLYILRFASQLQFEDKKHDVSMTALRLVQRMKRDSIHSGRRPSGICGAALLIAARLHNFSRTPSDVIRIVRVHESTLRKRLIEFGETPSSALTLDEFMTVDLEEEQDPPAFRAARKRDKDRLQKLIEEEDGERELTELQREIEIQLEKDSRKRKKFPVAQDTANENNIEEDEATRFAAEDTLNLLGEIVNEVQSGTEGGKVHEKIKFEKGLAPDLAVIGLGQSDDKGDKFLKPEPKASFAKDLHTAEEMVLNERDEDYVRSFIMTQDEVQHKTQLWYKINAQYLKEQKIKEELRAKEKEENKDKKRKIRGSYRKKTACNAATAGEAMEKMLAEKKISSKINYDILKSLDLPSSVPPASTNITSTQDTKPTPIVEIAVPESPANKKRKKKTPAQVTPKPRKGGANSTTAPSSFKVNIPNTPKTPGAQTPRNNSKSDNMDIPAPQTPITDAVEDYDDDLDDTGVVGRDDATSLAAMLQNEEEDEYYDDFEEY